MTLMFDLEDPHHILIPSWLCCCAHQNQTRNQYWVLVRFHDLGRFALKDQSDILFIVADYVGAHVQTKP